MEINWPSIIGTCVTVSAFLSGVGVGMLSLFIDNKLNKAERRIINHFDTRFALKETIDVRFDALDKRINKIDK